MAVQAMAEQLLAGRDNQAVVQAWLTKHSDPMYVTDLWFVVKEGENEIRIPACSAVLRLSAMNDMHRAMEYLTNSA